MWRRPAVTIVVLIIAMILTQPVRAQQKIVAPTLRSAQKRATGILPVKGHGQDGHGTSMSADLKVSATPAISNPAKPFSQEQVVSMVRDGFGDESDAKLIEQRGIDFTPSEDFIQTLKAAGASEAFLKALRAAKPPEPASTKKPLNQVQVFALLVGQVPSHRVTMLVQERGIDFEPTDEYLQEVRLAGGEDEPISALKSAKVIKPATVDPAAQARQTEIRRHVARGAELEQKRQFAEAEAEYRTALLLDSQNGDVYTSLAYVLNEEQKWSDAATAAREALRLNSNNDSAHYALGLALEQKGDLQGAAEEYRTAYALNPESLTYKQAYERGTLSGPKTENHPAKSSVEGLPTTELAKLDGTCQINSYLLQCEIYNGSNWTVQKIMIHISVKERDKKKGEIAVLSRQYTAVYGVYKDSQVGFLDPASSGTFYAYLGFLLAEHQHFEWKPVSALGMPAATK
jgi:tetratricopeptide (TPR) repeat protein